MNKIDITRFSQPQGPIQIDWANPITRGLLGAYSFSDSGAIEYISGVQYSSDLKSLATPMGVGAAKKTTSGINLAGKFQLTNNFSRVFVATPQTTGSGTISDSKASGNGGAQIQISAGVVALNVSNTINYLTLPISRTCCVGVGASNTRQTGWRDGVLVATRSGSVSFTSSGSGRLYERGDGSEDYDGVLVLHLDWGRVLSDPEFASITSNPWQIFKPIQKQIFIPVNTQIYTPQIFDDYFTDSNAVGSSEDGSTTQGSIEATSTDSITNTELVNSNTESYISTTDTWSSSDNNSNLLNVISNSLDTLLVSEIVELNVLVLVPQVLRPDAQLQNSGWLGSYTDINEPNKNTATYISTDAVGSIVEYSLSNAIDPISSTGHLPTFTMSSDAGGIIIRLKQGTTVIATWTYNTLANTPTDYTPILSGTEIDSITDYNDLRISFESIY